MVRIGECGVWCAAMMLGAASAVWATPAEKPRPDVSKRVEAIDEGQQALRSELNELRQQVRELNERVASLAEENRKTREAAAAGDEAAKQVHDELRESVRGLYVESSGLKGDVAQARQDVQELGASMDRFRFSSGILIAVVIVLQVILALLALRGRG